MLTLSEKEKILQRTKNQKFVANRKNCAPWCLQWIWLFFGVTGLIFYLLRDLKELDHSLYMIFGWLGLYVLNNLQWKRYQEQYLLHLIMNESLEPPSGSNTSNALNL